MKFASFASGSSGNCEYVTNGENTFLIDAGISTKRIVAGINEMGNTPENIDGIIITHEHSDHIKGIYVFSGKYNKPIYGTYDTLCAIEAGDKCNKIDTSLFRVIEPDRVFSIGDMQITPYRTSHDAADPVCYTVEDGEHKIGMATDLGVYDNSIISMLKGCELLFIEANYDVAMLQAGPYPFMLKKRILGNYGHLSNDMSARLILELLERKVKNLYLAHLSEENNYPMLAYETVKYELEKEYGDISRFALNTASRHTMSCVTDIG